MRFHERSQKKQSGWSDRIISGRVYFIETLKRKKTFSIIIPAPFKTIKWCLPQDFKATRHQKFRDFIRQNLPEKDEKMNQKKRGKETREREDCVMWSEGADDILSQWFRYKSQDINLHSTPTISLSLSLSLSKGKKRKSNSPIISSYSRARVSQPVRVNSPLILVK